MKFMTIQQRTCLEDLDRDIISKYKEAILEI